MKTLAYLIIMPILVVWLFMFVWGVYKADDLCEWSRNKELEGLIQEYSEAEPSAIQSFVNGAHLSGLKVGYDSSCK